MQKENNNKLKQQNIKNKTIRDHIMLFFCVCVCMFVCTVRGEESY